MKYVPYGKTGETVSALGFGGMRFDTQNKSMEENAELVRYASSQGITYFDTAPAYCDDKSEDIFGLAFQDMPGEFLVSTKKMPEAAPTADSARQAVEASLARLGVSAIDFFHVWCLREMAHYHHAMEPGGMYEGLQKCREEGLIKHIVFSSHQPGDEIRSIIEKGGFEGVLLGMNILNFPYRQEGAKAAVENGCGVVAMNPLAGGMIPQFEERLSFLCRDGETPTEAALRFCLSSPHITVTLNGFTTREQVDTACRMADKASPFSEEELARLTERLGSNMDSICTACGYCKGCPQNIPIARLMQFYNETVMFGTPAKKMRENLKQEMTWGMLVGSSSMAETCTECGLCEEKCTQHLPIIERLREIAAWEAADDPRA